jgi:predicted PurR-regulated permease PerM
MIDTESGRAQTLRFAIDLVVRLTLLAGIVYASLLLLSPIAGMLLWSAILAVAAHPLFALLRRRLHLYNALAASVLSLLMRCCCSFRGGIGG